MHALALALLCAPAPIGSSGAPPPAEEGDGKIFLTVEEALELAFPGCEVERTTAWLKPAEKQRVAKLSGLDWTAGVAFPYAATKDGTLVGTAYFDTHRVRTLRETIMVVVGPGERIRRIEVLAFAEPKDYLPRAKWYAQFVGRKLDDELALKRGIKGVAGATLTSRATTSAARSVLALHRVLRERPKEPPPKPPESPPKKDPKKDPQEPQRDSEALAVRDCERSGR